MGKILIAFLAVAIATPAFAEAERSLPKGEEHPQVIEKIYSSPVGEVQFLQVGADGHSALLRNARGLQVSFLEVRGPASCEEWLMSSKWSALPGGCEFVFQGDGGHFEAVRSEEMEETTLFQATRGLMRQWGRYVSL